MDGVDDVVVARIFYLATRPIHMPWSELQLVCTRWRRVCKERQTRMWFLEFNGALPTNFAFDVSPA